MRRRSREVQIFNLSMMDVISGAMGAFLIIMIVLMRYYESDPGNKANVEAIKAELESARERLRSIESAYRKAGIESSDIPRAIAETTKAISKADEKLEDLRTQLDEAKKEIERLETRNKTLEKRRAFAVAARWDCPADVDLYVWDTQKSTTGESVPAFDPSQEQGRFWTGDFRAEWEQGSPELWLVGSALPDTEFRIYVRLADPRSLQGGCLVETSIVHATGGGRQGAILSSEQPYDYVGRVLAVAGPEGQEFAVMALSADERRAEREAIAARMR